MKLLVECTVGEGCLPGLTVPLYRAWLLGEREHFELPEVEYIFGYAKETADRMGYPGDVTVKFAYGAITVPRDQVQVRIPQPSLEEIS